MMNNISKNVIPVGHTYIRNSVLEKGNILGVESGKSAWAKDLNLPQKAEYIFFAGCGYQLMKYADGMMGAVRSLEKIGMGMDQMIGVSKVFGKVGINVTGIVGKITAAGKEDSYSMYLVHAISVLKKLGVEIGYLGDDEPCCGSPLYYSGFVSDYIENAKKNYALFKSFGVKKIIGFVPACTSSLKELYPQLISDYDIEVKHFIQVVAEKLRDHKIKASLKKKTIVTYHDPCHLSRYLGLTKEPREILARIEGLELREPEPMQTGKWSTCCGGGGGMEVCFPEVAEHLAYKRVKELMATEANVIVTSCPACELQLRRGVEKVKANIKVLDLSEIVDQAL